MSALRKHRHLSSSSSELPASINSLADHASYSTHRKLPSLQQDISNQLVQRQGTTTITDGEDLQVGSRARRRALKPIQSREDSKSNKLENPFYQENISRSTAGADQSKLTKNNIEEPDSYSRLLNWAHTPPPLNNDILSSSKALSKHNLNRAPTVSENKGMTPDLKLSSRLVRIPSFIYICFFTISYNDIIAIAIFTHFAFFYFDFIKPQICI